MAIEDVDKKQRQLDELLDQATSELTGIQGPADLETARIKYLGRRGTLTAFFLELRSPSWTAGEKTQLGKKLNAVKEKIEALIEEKRATPSDGKPRGGTAADWTLPGILPSVGRLHPITQTIDEILEIFGRLHFAVVEGPEIETEFYNFEALNIPPEHPSRENFDTFYLNTSRAKLSSSGLTGGSDSRWSLPSTAIEGGNDTPFLHESCLKAEDKPLLRSHTSPVQVRYMQRHQPPFQIVVPGRVFRPDAVDASHCFQFHQIEGLAVGSGLTFGDLKGVLIALARGMFGAATQVRFRPHYFPFTEPSAEVDVSCVFCHGKGCRVCGNKGWLEILGCGMVHPEVFKAVGYLPGTVGFAFGLGVERICMLKYGIEDIRLFFENDIRFLAQFP